MLTIFKVLNILRYFQLRQIPLRSVFPDPVTYTTLMMEHDSLQEVDSDHMRRNNTILLQCLL